MWRKLFKKSRPPSADSAKGQKDRIKKKDQAWVGVDLDGTLVFSSDWKGIHHVGKPVPEMMARLKHWLELGIHVKIMTARASVPEGIAPVQKWLAKQGLPELEVTNEKDFYMVELWDDRAIQVMENTGKPVLSPSVLSHPKVDSMVFQEELKRQQAEGE